jgi:hypothetical protein
MTAIFTIVGSARSRHISPCIAADRDWITKKNQKAKHSMSNPARRRKLPGGVFFCRCASYRLCLPVCRIPMETHERRNTIETVFLRRRSNFHGNVYPPSEPSPYQQPTKKQRAQRSPANVHTSWRLMALRLDATRGSRKPATQTSLEEQPVKTCFQCQGKLGLAIRARNVWNGRWWWSHVYFCSARCEDRYELEQSEANAKPQKLGFFARGSAQL